MSPSDLCTHWPRLPQWCLARIPARTLLAVFLVATTHGLGASAQASDDTPVAKVAAALGQSFVLRNGDKVAVSKGMDLYRTDQLVTGATGMVRIVFADGSSVVASKESSFEIEEYQTRANGRKLGLDSVMGLVRGKIRVLIKPRDGGHNAVVKSKNAVMGVRGTEFVVSQEGTDAPGKQVTNLIVLQGAVALAPLDDEGNPLGAADRGNVEQKTGPQQGAALLPEVLVRAGEQSTVVAQAPPSKPQAAEAARLVDVQKEAQTLATPESIPDQEVTKSLVLPPPPPPPRAGRGGDDLSSSRWIRRERERVLALEPAQASGSGEAQGSTQPPAATTPAGASSQGGAAAEGRTVVVIPRDPALVSEIGMACNTASLERLRGAARTFDEETVPLANQLLGCDEFQDEAFFWLYAYHMARGEVRRAANVTKGYQPTTGALDLVTPREFDLKLFRNKRTDEILKRAGKAGARDRQLVLLAARSAVITGKFDQALALYDEALRRETLGGSKSIRWERIFVLMLKGDYAAAEDGLDALAEQDLSVGEQAAVVAASASVRRQKLGATPDDVNVRGYGSLGNHSDGYGRHEFGVAWQGRIFDLTTGLGGVRLANEGRGGSDDFGYARLGGGARLRFSTGATAAASVDLYGSDKPNVGARLTGTYPVFKVAEASLLVAREPLFTEFVSLADQVSDSIFRLGWGLRAYDVVSYAGVYSSYSDSTSSLDNRIRGTIPVHRTGMAARRLDLIVEGRHFGTSEDSLERYTPKSALSFLGGADWNWTFGRRFEFGAAALFGYLTRSAHDAAGAAAGDTSGAAPASLPAVPAANLPWVERSRLKTALVGEALLSATWNVRRQLALTLAANGAFENAQEEISKDEASTTAGSTRPSDKARHETVSSAVLGLQWNYGKP